MQEEILYQKIFHFGTFGTIMEQNKTLSLEKLEFSSKIKFFQLLPFVNLQRNIKKHLRKNKEIIKNIELANSDGENDFSEYPISVSFLQIRLTFIKSKVLLQWSTLFFNQKVF